MIQELLKGDVHHCNYCHKYFEYIGEVTGCGKNCCHGADVPLTPDEVWKEHQKQNKKYKSIKI